jgi:hypothetical protein
MYHPPTIALSRMPVFGNVRERDESGTGSERLEGL